MPTFTAADTSENAVMRYVVGNGYSEGVRRTSDDTISKGVSRSTIRRSMSMCFFAAS